VTVFYDHIPDSKTQGKGFGESFTWDLPLLQGYPWRVFNRNGRQREKESEFDRFKEAYRAVDVMLIHGWQSSYMRRAWWKGFWSNTPLLVRGESNALRDRPWYLRELHREYLRPFDKYLYIGEGNRQFYRNAGVPAESLYFAPYCIENERFDKDWQNLKEDRTRLRTEMGIEKSAVCFLFCGKFIEKKKPTDVVEAFEAARRQLDTPTHLLMVGDGELYNEAKRQVVDETSVTFTGFLNQTEIGKTYAAADVMVLPSNYGETWGLVVNEGMIFECPAIVSDRVGCGPDLIQEEKTGVTFPFGDLQALATAMARMAEVPEQVREMGAQARRLVLSDYTIQQAADGIVSAAQDAHTDHA
jgi:glycosyltransferase involved in cell wall biosynthesis